MNTKRPPCSCRVSQWLALSVVGLASLAAGRAADAAGPERYRLFVGLDLEVPWKETYQPVRGVLNNQLGVEIVVNGDRQRVLIDRAESLRMKREMKVARTPVEIGGFQAERCYSPLTDPVRKWMSAQITMSSQQEVMQQEAHGQLMSRALEFVDPRREPARVEAGHQAIQERMSESENFLGTTTAPLLSDPAGFSRRMQSDSAQELYDAIEVVFDVSAPEIVADAYVVLLANYRVPGRQENFRFIYTQAIGTIDERPKKVRLWSGGLPSGYQIVDTKVHVYAHGLELPSNLSDKTVEVSEGQALRVLTAAHVNSHRGQSVPAQPVWQTAPSNFRARLDFSALPRQARLEIDAEGRVVSVLNESGEPLPVRGLLRDVLMETRYLPALEKGTPVATTMNVELAKFLQ